MCIMVIDYVELILLFVIVGLECHPGPDDVLRCDGRPGGAGYGEDHPETHEQEGRRPRRARTVPDIRGIFLRTHTYRNKDLLMN